jgi:uncharacterized protein (TIGR00251 family)
LNENKNIPTVRLAVKITPNAGRNEITGFKDDVLNIKIGAPPEKGKANKELIDFLAEKLRIRKSSVTIIRGQTSHRKIIAIEGIDQADITKIIPAKE